jgi:CRISPR system Cascade subunit CasC
MTIKIEFHCIQSFPPANLNRDDTNMPKDCEFGGVRRARISSQCIKRSIRLHPDFEQHTGVAPGERTRLLAVRIAEQLVQADKAQAEAEQVAQGFVGGLLKKMDNKKPNRSSVLFYISQEEIQTVVAGLLADWEKALDGKFDDLIKGYEKEFADRNSAPDIALFGRMLADRPNLGLEASCQVAHAISTHSINMEMDFFTAVDDLQQGEDSGAGMMGITGFNAATFYRYAAIDWGQLMDNLGGNVELARNTVVGFTAALAKAVPTGKQNAFAAQTPPAMVLVVVREDGQAWSLANAFEQPINKTYDNGILGASMKAFDTHWHQLNSVYGDRERPVKPLMIVLGDEENLPHLREAKVASLDDMLEALALALPTG